MDPRRVFGNRAEKLAEQFLKNTGMNIVARQYKTKIGEIDLIARDGDEIVFVEVKARRSSTFGYPEESVTQAKLKKITLVSQQYLKDKQIEDILYRIDVIAIEMRQGSPVITHIKYAA
jgi:putative endonuclease